MYVVSNRVFVTDDWTETFEERFQKRAGQIEKQPGFVRMRVMRPVSEGAPYVVLTEWQDEAVFKDWVNSADFKSAHSNPMPSEAFDKKGGMERHEVVISAES